MTEASKRSAQPGWNMTLWLCLRVLIAEALAQIPVFVFTNDFLAILTRWGALPPAQAPTTPTVTAGSLTLGLALCLLIIAAPLVWIWPIGRYLDDAGEDLREKALRRFAGINAFYAAFFCAAIVWNAAGQAWSVLHGVREGSFWAGAALDVFGAYFGAYFTLLTLEPMLLRDLAEWLYQGQSPHERKRGPIWTVRTKLLLLVANLIVIPMALVGASMRLGLTGYSQGLGVAILTAVVAIGYTEMLYRGLALPLERLNAKMTRVSQGDYSAKTTVLSDDEVGQLKWHFNEMVDGLAERERLKDTFGRFVSVEIAKRLIETNVLSLGGENIEATILFSDIRDFTPLSESLPPQELVALLNRYFSFVTEPIAAHHGVVNKFIGDAVMAIFAPQFGSKDHAEDALRAAKGMRVKLAEFNATRAEAAPIRFGIGVHSGLLVAGNIGTEKRMEYTVIGDTVNVAARIESKTKDLGCDILVSESVYDRLPAAERSAQGAQRCDGVRVKGKEAPLVVYKIG